VLGGLHRERAALPAAAGILRQATQDASAVLACFQGVQDDLLKQPAGSWTPLSVEAAKVRLLGCDVSPLESDLRRLALPPTAALDGGAEHRARAAIESAAAALRQTVLDAKVTKRAMSVNLSSGREGEILVLGYRSAQEGYKTASGLLEIAESLAPSDRSSPAH
jgi:hypothetical protein